MFCWTCRRLLVGYLECELEESTRAKVEAHLVRCPRCAAELEMIRQVGGALRSNPVEPTEPPADLWARIKSEIESSRPRVVRRSWVRVSQAVGACAAMVLVGVVGFGLLKPQIQEVSAPPVTGHRSVGNAGKTPGRHGLPSNIAGKEDKVAAPPRIHSHPSLPTKNVERIPVPSLPRQRSAAGGKQVALYEPGTLVTGKSAGLPEPSGPVADARSDESVVPPELKRVRITSDIAAKTVTEDQSSVTIQQPAAEPATSAMAEGVGSEEDRSARVIDGNGAEYKLMATGGPVGGSAHAFPGAGGDDESGWQSESVVDVLNRTDGIWRVALFSYP